MYRTVRTVLSDVGDFIQNLLLLDWIFIVLGCNKTEISRSIKILWRSLIETFTIKGLQRIFLTVGQVFF